MSSFIEKQEEYIIALVFTKDRKIINDVFNRFKEGKYVYDLAIQRFIIESEYRQSNNEEKLKDFKYYLAVLNCDYIFDGTYDEKHKPVYNTDSNGNELLSINQETGKAVIGTEEFEIFDGSKYLAQPSVLQQAIMNGTAFLYDTKAVEDAEEPLPLLQAKVEYQYVLDTSDDAAAESKYDYETAKLSQQDNNLELDLKQLETQHEAVMKEYESVKEVISNNVERTFNLFSNG